MACGHEVAGLCGEKNAYIYATSFDINAVLSDNVDADQGIGIGIDAAATAPGKTEWQESNLCF